MKPDNNTAVPAKVSRPRLTSKVLLRKRLFSILKDGLEARAVWVSGPAGAGKTTFVNSYIDANRVKTLWYHVDSADADPATFFLYLRTWLEAVSRKDPAMPRFSPQAASNLAAFSNVYFREFFHQLSSPYLVVLDNFQEASFSSEFIEAVSAAIRLAPQGSAFVLISRTEPVSDLALACGSGLSRIGWDDIRLTEGESADIARLHGAGLNRAGIGRIHAKADGWMAGLLLLLEQAKTGCGPIEGLSWGAGDLSFDYFMSEVFDKIDPATQELLLKASLFQDMTPRMVADISGLVHAAGILDSMSSGNFFVARRSSGEEESYQFHPLFRDFLLERAKRVFSPEELRGLMVRAAGISVKAGQTDWAARLFMEARDWSGLSRFIHEHAPSFISQGRLKALQDILKELPGQVVRSSPWLLYYYGLCRLPESPGSAREMFEAAYALFEQADEGKGAFLAWTGAVDTILYEWKDFKPLDRWIAEFERLMRKYGGFPTPEIEVRATTCIFSAIMFRMPDHPALPAWEERIRALVEAVTDNALKISITRNLILYYLWTGHVKKAGVLVERLKPAANEAVRDPLAELMWLRSAALYRMFLSSSLPALEAIDEGLALADKTGIHLLDNLFYGVGIYACMILGDIDRAEDFLGRMKKGLDSERSLDLIYYNHQASMIAWNRGRLPEAIEHAEVALGLALQSGSRINIVIYEGAHMLLLIEAERFEGIEGRVAALRDFGRSIKSHLHEAIGLLTEAFLFFKKGDSVAFARSFEGALSLFKRHEINSIGSLFRPVSFAPLCAKALELGIETEFLKKLIRLNNIDRFPPDPAIEDWPWEIKVLSLGRFEIYRDNEKIESRKAQQKPLSMLKELISSGGRPVPEGAVTDALWPASEGDLAYKSFNTTVHRLRRLLRSEKAVRHIDGMLSLERPCFWVDAWAFDHLLEKAERSCPEEAEVLLKKAALIYKGEYLPGETHSSVASCREGLKARFLKCLEKAGTGFEDAGDHGKALELYAKGIEADALAEDLYRRMMACQHAMGDRKGALRTYESLRCVLSERLKIRPSRQTEELYRVINEK